MKKLKRTCLTLTLMMVMLFAMAITAAAETVPMSGAEDTRSRDGKVTVQMKDALSAAAQTLSQTDATKSSATVSWMPGAANYFVYLNDAYVGAVQATIYQFTGLIQGSLNLAVVIGSDDPAADPNALYQQLVTEVNATGNTTLNNVFLNYVVATPGKPEEVASSKYKDTYVTWIPSNSSYPDVTFGWYSNKNDQYTSDGWEVQIYDVAGKKKIKKYTVQNQYVDYPDSDSAWTGSVSFSKGNKKIKNIGFSVKVKPFVMINGAKKYGTTSARKVIIPQAKTKLKANNKNASYKVSWNKIKNATKYEVWVCKDVQAANPKFKKVKTLNKSQTSYTIKKMKLNQHYGVYIKAVVKYGKKTYKSTACGYDECWFY